MAAEQNAHLRTRSAPTNAIVPGSLAEPDVMTSVAIASTGRTDVNITGLKRHEESEELETVTLRGVKINASYQDLLHEIENLGESAHRRYVICSNMMIAV